MSVPKTYQGAPCSKGHGGLRYRANSNCVECSKERSAEQYARTLRAIRSVEAEDARRVVDIELQLARAELAKAARHFKRAKEKSLGFRDLWRDALANWGVSRKLADLAAEFETTDWLGG
jgi:hypothetical protein